MFLAKVFVQLKATVNDPQGRTIQGGLRQLGFATVESVRSGKYLEIRLDEDAEDAAAAKVGKMCEQLLANPIIEDYRFELERVSGS